MSATSLAGRRVLIVEDEYFIACDIARDIAAEGGTVLGPFATSAEAMAVVERGEAIDTAILDVNVKGVLIYPVADALLKSGVKVVFSTGYDISVLPDRFREVARLEKPADREKLIAVLSK